MPLYNSSIRIMHAHMILAHCHCGPCCSAVLRSSTRCRVCLLRPQYLPTLSPTVPHIFHTPMPSSQHLWKLSQLHAAPGTGFLNCRRCILGHTFRNSRHSAPVYLGIPGLASETFQRVLPGIISIWSWLWLTLTLTVTLFYCTEKSQIPVARCKADVSSLSLTRVLWLLQAQCAHAHGAS